VFNQLEEYGMNENESTVAGDENLVPRGVHYPPVLDAIKNLSDYDSVHIETEMLRRLLEQYEVTWQDGYRSGYNDGVQHWQPIETAPKMRKVMVGYLNSLGVWRSVMARYYLPGTLELADDADDTADGYAPEGWYEECETSECISFTDEPPTHWMPLAASPHDAFPAKPDNDGE
jgi:hypothetical protein